MSIENVYVFNNWTSVSQMINHIDEHIKVNGTVVISDGTCVGHVLTVYNELDNPVGTSMSNVLYRVPVEVGLDNTWSISKEQAIELLNKVGFRCQWKTENLSPSPDTIDVCKALSELGATQVVRKVSPELAVEVLVNGDIDKSLTESLRYHPEYNYQDWLFLQAGVITRISDIVKEG